MIKLRYKSYTTASCWRKIDRRKTGNSVVCISMQSSKADMDKKVDRKPVSFRLPEELLQELRERADADAISVTELVYRFLKQGLQSNVDDRIAELETQIRDLKQSKSVPTPMSPASFYSLLPQSFVASEADPGVRGRIERLEALMEEVLIEQRTYVKRLEEVLVEQRNNSKSIQEVSKKLVS